MTLDVTGAMRAARDDGTRAVSPVIGVVLMVAVTVTLVAAIASFVLGLSTRIPDQTAEATFTFKYEADRHAAAHDWYAETTSGADGVLTVTHARGGAIAAGQLTLAGSSAADGRLAFSAVDSGVDGDGTVTTYHPESDIVAGEKVQLAMASDDTIWVIWTNEAGTKSAILRKFAGPDT